MPTTQARANAASAALLERMLGRSRTLSLDAVAAYWARPGMTVDLTTLDGQILRHLVATVSFRPIEGRMSLTTRVPENLGQGVIGTTTAVPPVWSAPDPDPAPPPKQTYVSSWIASSSGTYKGTGVKRTDTDNMVQGYNGSNGNGAGIAMFLSANSTGSETAKTITTALSGATVSKVEAYLWAEHWYSGSGGIGRLGYYNGTSLPASFASGAPYITSTAWPRSSGRWVNITSTAFKAALVAGTARGVTIGPGSGSSLTYYGRFHGALEARKPALRITYAK